MVCEWTAGFCPDDLTSVLLDPVLDFVVVVALLPVVFDEETAEDDAVVEEEEEADVDVWKATEEEKANAESAPCPLMLSCPLDEPWVVGRFLCFMTDGAWFLSDE